MRGPPADGASWSLLPALRGVPLYFQAGQFDPMVGFFDYSRGLELLLGD